MSYGHPVRSKWGSATFGAFYPKYLKAFRVDSSVRAILAGSFSVDSILGLSGLTGLFAVDSSVRALKAGSFSVDAFSLRLPTGLYNLQETHPVILVEMRLPGGTVRVANRIVMVGSVAYDGRLVSIASVLRTITEGTDEVQLVLDDTDTRGPRFRDLFAANAPESSGVTVWIGLTDDPDFVENRIHLFEGKIDRVPGFSRAQVTVDVLRNEVVDDRLMGRIVTLADFPDAPDEVLGSMVPIVFGRNELSPGIVTNTNELGRLFFNHFVSDTTIKLVDSTSFPATGTVQIGEEQVTYTGNNTTAGELTGATRGANGTIASDHARDAEVTEIGPFVVKFNDGPSDRIESIKLKDPQGNLGEPVPGPTSIDNLLSTATWDALPKIRSAGTASAFHRVHFDAQGPGNLATDARFAARENPGYGTFDYAKVSPGNPLEVQTNTDDLGQPGDIKRVWLAVVHDTAPPEVAEQVEDASGFTQRSDGEVAEGVVFAQIFAAIPLPDGGFTNATTTAERVRNSIDDDGVDPATATIDEMTRSIHGIPNGYDIVAATFTATLVTAAVAAEQAAAVAHDQKVTDAKAAVLAATNAAVAAGATVTFPGRSPQKFQLVAQDLTPVQIARFDDRTNDRMYDVEVQAETALPETKTIIAPVEIEESGIWTNAPKITDRHELLNASRESAESIFDGDDDTTGDATFNVPGEANSGDGPGFAARVRFLPGQEESNASGFEVVNAYIRVWVDTVTLLGYIYAPLLAYLEDSSGKIAGTEVRCRHFTQSGSGGEIATGCILAPAEFRSDTAPHGTPGGFDFVAVLGKRLQNLSGLRMVLEPSAPATGSTDPVTCLNTWIAHTCDLVIELEKPPPPDPVIDDRKGITNHFEVTDFVDGDWSFFSDLARGGAVTIESAAGELRALEVYWVVEYQPFFDVSSSVPEVFADVTGRVPGGNPADISENVITTDAPNGMGLPQSSISSTDYNPARVGFNADGIRADFTITEQINTLELLATLAEQCDYRQAWSQGRHRIVRKPIVGGLLKIDGILTAVSGDALVASRQYRQADVLRDSLAFSRTALDGTVTRFAATFKPLAHTSESGGSVEVVSDAAEVEFGRRELSRDLFLIRDPATAEFVTSRDLLRRSAPRWLAEFFLPLFGLEVQLGDVVGLDHPDFSFQAGEVLDTSVETIDIDGSPFIAVEIRLIVWQK